MPTIEQERTPESASALPRHRRVGHTRWLSESAREFLGVATATVTLLGGSVLGSEAWSHDHRPRLQTNVRYVPDTANQSNADPVIGKSMPLMPGEFMDPPTSSADLVLALSDADIERFTTDTAEQAKADTDALMAAQHPDFATQSPAVVTSLEIQTDDHDVLRAGVVAQRIADAYGVPDDQIVVAAHGVQGVPGLLFLVEHTTQRSWVK